MKTFYLLLIAFTLTTISASADDGPLKGHMDAFTVSVADDGTEQLQPAGKAAPGNVIEYQLAYENTGDAPLGGLVVTGPVPDGVAYLEDTAHNETAADLQASYDDGASWHPLPVTRIVTNANGEAREEIVPASEYTHLRWTAVTPLAPQSTSKYSYRVQVNTN